MALYAFDGTWNEPDLTSDPDHTTDSNVRRFFEAFQGTKNYIAGVGTRYGALGRFVGGTFGAGAKKRLREGWHALAQNWAAGDHVIDIVGFSRGAAMALVFANIVEEYGVGVPGTKRWFPRRRHGLGWVRAYKKTVKDPKPRVRLLGLWDTVGSFGFPKSFIIPFQKINLGFDLSVPTASVDHCFHALSLDELRETFRLTHVDGYEVWFRGVHSNVGGGYADRGLSDIALEWMFKKAEDCGLSFDLSKTEALKPDIEGKFGEPNDPRPDPPRKVGAGDRVHPTAFERTGPVSRPMPDDVVKSD